MTQRRYWALLCRIQGELGQAALLGAKEPMVRLKAQTVGSYVPHYWRDEAKSPEEWFIRSCRSIGLHASLNVEDARYEVRWVRGLDDEATITWPKDIKAIPWRRAWG